LEEGDEGIVAVNCIFSPTHVRDLPRGASSKVVNVEAAVWEPVDAEDGHRAGKGKNNQNDRLRPRGLHGRDHWYRMLTARSRTNWVSLLIVDTVASLAPCQSTGHQRIDICFSGSQKAISAPGKVTRLQ